MNCTFCGAAIPQSRYKFKRYVKYCSGQCVKRMWYKLRNPGSYFNGSTEFWKTSTGVGFRWEKYAATKLGARHIEFTRKADLDWNGKAVDVKVAHPYRRKDGKSKEPVWVFNRNSRKKNVDFFFCICLDEKDQVLRELLVPNKVFPNVGMVLGRKSKYDRFIFKGYHQVYSQ